MPATQKQNGELFGSANIPKYVAEFLGTYILVLSVGCNVLGSDPEGPPWAPVSIACSLMVGIYALAGVSGANLNPAVSLGLAICGALKPAVAGIYCIAQVLGGICAGFTYLMMFQHSFNLSPQKNFGAWQVGVVEFIYTAMLVFVVLNCAVSKRNNPEADPNQFFGLAIGFVIVAGGYAGGNISGGCFNPAVSAGIDIASAGLGFGWCFAYLGFQALGAIAAAGLYSIVRPDDSGENASLVDKYTPTTVSKLASEFLGTFILVLTVCLNVLQGSKATALSAAAALMCMIYSLGNVSGAHFNPAVTFGLKLAYPQKQDTTEVAMYMGTQVFAGLAAACLASATYGWKKYQLVPTAPQYYWGSIAAAEILFTFVLVFVVMCVATVKLTPKSPSAQNNIFGLAIGMCVTVGGFAIGPISGGSLNPAVSASLAAFGEGAFASGSYKVIQCFPYILYELVGGALAAGAFYVTHPDEYRKSAGQDARV